MSAYSSKQTVSNLMQSRYYSPAFDAAIFDGPLRIYFAQYQEPEALKIYFRLQEKMREMSLQGQMRGHQKNIFVMVYPNRELFERSFSGVSSHSKMQRDHLAEDLIFGLHGELTNENLIEMELAIADLVHLPNLHQAPQAEVF